MITWPPIFHILGFLLTLFALVMLIPAGVDIWMGSPGWIVFIWSSVITFVFGSLLFYIGWFHAKDRRMQALNIRQSFVMTAFIWILMGLFGALPFMLDTISLSPVDAVFESVSGITTTGATVITGLSEQQPGILLWRALQQWIGGLGFVALAILILPMLRVGGMQIFQLESSDRSEKFMPRMTQIVRTLILVYLIISVACFISLLAVDFNWFDATVHAMTTVSTGGYSTIDSSVGGFYNPAAEWILSFFMLIAGFPFLVLGRALFGNVGPMLKSTQIRAYVLTVIGAILILFAYYMPFSEYDELATLRLVTFNVISVITTTGYVTADYSLWGGFSLTLFFFLMFFGACAGSTASGLKTYRLQILFATAKAQAKRLLHPHGVFSPYYNKRPVGEEVSMSVMSFLYVFIAVFVVIALGLSFMGLDLLTAFSAVAAAMCNVGPGLGDIVGPSGTYTNLPDAAKWLLSIAMLLGRLEFFTVLVLFTPLFWKN